MSCPTCNTCKKSSALCGCEDKGLTTGPSCEQGTPACPNPEPCAETFSDCCVIHNGASIVDPEGNGINIFQGDRVCDILQRMVQYFLNPACVESATCPQPVGLLLKGSTSTSLTIGWTPSSNATQYQAYKWDTGTLAWITDGSPFTATTIPQYTYTGLSPNTTYYVKVSSICGLEAPACSSVSIQVKTKSA